MKITRRGFAGLFGALFAAPAAAKVVAEPEARPVYNWTSNTASFTSEEVAHTHTLNGELPRHMHDLRSEEEFKRWSDAAVKEALTSSRLKPVPSGIQARS